MYGEFPLFKGAVELFHRLLPDLIEDGDAVVDATCGNGKDSVVLARVLCQKKSTSLHCIDIQEQAVEHTKTLLLREVPDFFEHVRFYVGSHETLPSVGSPGPKLILYNLGWLPGSDKTVTTRVSSTLISVTRALELLRPGGVVNITCYPGHKEGEEEERALTLLSDSLDPKRWNCTFARTTNRHRAPSLLCIQKSLRIGD